MHPHLIRLQQEISSATAGFSIEQLNWHPPAKWCAAEILEHLYRTYTGTAKGMERVIQAGKPLSTSSTLKKRAQAFLVLGLGYMPVGRESPAGARPRGVPAPTLLAEIGPKIAEMNDLMKMCERKLGTRIKVLDHPFLGPFSVAQWRKFHLVHGLHHVRQIRALKQSIAAQPALK